MNDYHHHHHLLVLYFDDDQVARNKKSFSFQVHQSHHKCFIPFPNFCFFQINNFTIPTIRKCITKVHLGDECAIKSSCWLHIDSDWLLQEVTVVVCWTGVQHCPHCLPHFWHIQHDRRQRKRSRRKDDYLDADDKIVDGRRLHNVLQLIQ